MAGDTAAFEQLAQRHANDAYRVAVALVGPEDARDVTQDAMVAAWRRLSTLRDSHRFKPWLHTLVLNHARNALRARRRRPSVTLTDEHAAFARGESLSDVESLMNFASLVEPLTPDMRAVLVLHYVVDLPMREVARIVGVREGTAKSRLNAALNVLRRTTADAGE